MHAEGFAEGAAGMLQQYTVFACMSCDNVVK